MSHVFLLLSFGATGQHVTQIVAMETGLLGSLGVGWLTYIRLIKEQNKNRPDALNYFKMSL